MPSFVENLEAAAKLTALVLGNMEGIARASQSIAQFGPGAGATLVLGQGDGSGGAGVTGTASPFSGKVGMGGNGGSGGGSGVVYGAAGSAFLRSALGGAAPESRDGVAIVTAIDQLGKTLSKALMSNNLGTMLRAGGGL